MQTVMCFGDSITWGQDPVTRQRMPFQVRWPGVLQRGLGDRVRVVEEALCDRTTVWDDPFLPNRSGSAMLGTLLESHSPVDLLIVMLGTNDFQRQYRRSAEEVAIGCGALITVAEKSTCGPENGAPAILVVAPPPLGPLNSFARLYFEGQEPQSRQLAPFLGIVTSTAGCDFLDAGEIVRSSAADGVHLDQPSHLQLGKAIVERARALLPPHPM